MDGGLAIEPNSRPAHQRANGAVTLGVKADAGVTRIDTLYHSHPLRVLFPRPAKHDPMTAAIATVSGGIAGGDRLILDVSASEGAEALVVAQAAEKVYRAPDPEPARIDLTLSVAPGAKLEYLPQETIIFDQARLKRQTTLRLADESAEAMAGELLVLGRGAHGETFKNGAISETWSVSLGDRLVWRDAFRWTAEAAQSPFGLGDATAIGTIVIAHSEPGALIETARAYCLDGTFIGATQIGPLAVLRILGADPAGARAAFMALWGLLREAAFGRPSRLPPIIHC